MVYAFRLYVVCRIVCLSHRLFVCIILSHRLFVTSFVYHIVCIIYYSMYLLIYLRVRLWYMHFVCMWFVALGYSI
jgi:hypothetical protein